MVPFERAPRTGGGAKGRRASVFVPELAVAREETYEEDEDQPGDIDYEYVMCLMRWCACMRPAIPEDPEELHERAGTELLVRQASTVAGGRGKRKQQKGSVARASVASARSDGPWAQVADPNSGRTYWFNAVTNETSWEKPASAGRGRRATHRSGRANTTLSML